MPRTTDPLTLESKLVLDRNYQTVWTNRREMDVETALATGLQQYILSLCFDAGLGRFIRFLDAFEEWPDTEEKATYPTALVRSTGNLQYDSSSFTPTGGEKLNSTQWLFFPSEASTTFELEVWSVDREQRKGLTMMLEDAFNPDPDQYGFSLTLPFYHGALGRYSLQSKRKMDNEGDVQRRYRKMSFSLDVRAPLVRLFTLPVLQPQINVEFTSTQD